MFTFKCLLAIGTLLNIATPAFSQTVVKINALGDSITGNPGCWRALLWQKLQAAGVTNTDFVGTLNPDGCGFAYDGQHDGHGGFLATGIVRDNQLPGWLAISQPDIVMMELGTNDVWSNVSPATLVAALGTLVDQMRAQKPTMRVLVAQITPMLPSGCTDCPARVVAYNAAIAAWAPTKSTTASPITVVDCWTGFDTSTDFGDGVHPNGNGNIKLANCWYEPLKAAIALAGGGTLPPTSSSSTTFVTTTVSRTTTSSVVPTTSLRTSSTTTSVRTSSSTTTSLRTSSSTTTVSRTTSPTTSSTTTTSSGGGPLAERWAKCGGVDWTGPTACVSPWVCTFSNQWYSQCL